MPGERWTPDAFDPSLDSLHQGLHAGIRSYSLLGWVQAFLDDAGGAPPRTPDAHAGRRMLDAGQRWTPDAFDPYLEPLHDELVLESQLPLKIIKLFTITNKSIKMTVLCGC